MIGAAKRATLYGYANDVQLMQFPAWVDFVREVDHKVFSQQIDFPQPLKKRLVQQWLVDARLENKMAEMMFMAILWGTTQRPNCVFQLRPRNIEVGKEKISFLFVEGKGVRSRHQPFCIQTNFGPMHSPLGNWIQTRQHRSRLFDKHSDPRPWIRRKLRSLSQLSHRRYDLRSFRRGSLEQLGINAVSANTLLAYSGHKLEDAYEVPSLGNE